MAQEGNISFFKQTFEGAFVAIVGICRWAATSGYLSSAERTKSGLESDLLLVHVCKIVAFMRHYLSELSPIGLCLSESEYTAHELLK